MGETPLPIKEEEMENVRPTPFCTLIGFALIALTALAFLWVLSLVTPAFGAVPAPRDILSLTDRIPYSEDLDEKFHAKVAEMRQRLFIQGCKVTKGYGFMRDNFMIVTMACQDTERR